MKFNLLSNNRKFVDSVMLIGSILLGLGVIMQMWSYGQRYSILVLGMALLIASWSGFSHPFVKAKESGINPSTLFANISFLILSIFWGILVIWIYLITR